MTGLDQEMMQKNISIEKLGNSQKNMFTFSVVMVIVNFIFLFMGGLLYMYAAQIGVDAKGDDLYPILAFQKMSPIIGVVFIIPFVYFLIKKKLDKETIKKCFVLLGMGAFQGFLGWFMVASGLKDMPDVSHFRLAIHLTFAFITNKDGSMYNSDIRGLLSQFTHSLWNKDKSVANVAVAVSQVVVVGYSWSALSL